MARFHCFTRTFLFHPTEKGRPKNSMKITGELVAHLVSPNSSGNLQEGPGTWRGTPDLRGCVFPKLDLEILENAQGRGITPYKGMV